MRCGAFRCPLYPKDPFPLHAARTNQDLACPFEASPKREPNSIYAALSTVGHDYQRSEITRRHHLEGLLVGWRFESDHRH